MSQYITKIRTDAGDLQIDYNALANLPDLSVKFSNPNLLINGDFQIWQRGQSFSNIANQYAADRWMIKNAKGNTSLVERSTDIPSSEFLRQSIHITETLEENTYLRYNFENALKGTFTLSFWYKTSVEFNSYIYDNSTLVHLGKLTTLNTWTKATFTFTATSMTFINIIHAMSAGNCYIAGVKLEYGDIATVLMPRTGAEERLLCQRYYQVVSSYRFPAMMFTSDVGSGPIPLEVGMRTTPTVSIVSFRYFDTTQGAHVEAAQVSADADYTTNRVVVIQFTKNSASTLTKGNNAYGTIHVQFDAEIY